MSQYPVIEVGDLWTADLANSMMPNHIIKSVNQSITSSTTYQVDSELVTPTLAVGLHEIYLYLVVTSQTAVKVKWTNTGTMSNNRKTHGPGSVTGTAEDNSTIHWQMSGFGTDVVYGFRSAGSQYHIEEFATISVSVAGAITVNWGQNASNANATTIVATSYWKCKQIA